MTIDIAINARTTRAHITRRNPRGGAGTTRRYNLTPSSAARLLRLTEYTVQRDGIRRATITK